MQKRVGVRGPGAFRSTENPNIDAYVYQAALLCRDCAVATMNEFELHNMFCGSTCGLAAWPHSWQESDYYPQGPYANGGGEADSPQHCDACGVFLENPLTPDGTRYVLEKLVEHARDGSGSAEVLKQWADHYNAHFFEPGNVTLQDLEFESSLDDDDWGSVMAWWFAIAGELYTRDEALPEEWQYKPGLHPVDPDDAQAPLVAGAPAEVLFEFMKTIEADATRLKAEGKDYLAHHPCTLRRAGVRASGASRSRDKTQ